MSAFVANLAVTVGLLVAGVALVLAIVGFLSYTRLRHTRLLWISIAFVGFVAQGAVLTVRALQQRSDPVFPTLGILSLAILLALYAAVLRR